LSSRVCTGMKSSGNLRSVIEQSALIWLNLLRRAFTRLQIWLKARMGFKDFLLLFTVCFVWGLNIVITRWVVFDAAIPPIFFAAIRFLGVSLLLIPFLRPIPKDIKTLFFISFFIGSGHFALLFLGLANAEASAAAIVGQLGVPFSTLMSMAFLGEKVGWRRGLGITLAFAGVFLIAVDPESFSVSIGLLYIAGAAFIDGSTHIGLNHFSWRRLSDCHSAKQNIT